MLKYFLPEDKFDSIFEIGPDYLKEKNIRGIITDLDNTLVAWDEPEATPELVEWFANMKAAGIAVTIVSNNNDSRVRSFSTPLGIPFFSKARKPLGKTFKRAMESMDMPKENVVMIGDQLLTDVLGGNRLGLHTVLVVPVSAKDGWNTRLNRQMERFILSIMKRKGMLNWEE